MNHKSSPALILYDNLSKKISLGVVLIRFLILLIKSNLPLLSEKPMFPRNFFLELLLRENHIFHPPGVYIAGPPLKFVFDKSLPFLFIPIPKCHRF